MIIVPQSQIINSHIGFCGILIIFGERIIIMIINLALSPYVSHVHSVFQVHILFNLDKLCETIPQAKYLPDIQKYLNISKSTSKYPKVTQSTQKYLKVPKSISKYPKVPQSIQKYLKVSKSTSGYPKVPQSNQKYLKVPRSASKYPEVARSTSK